MKNVIIVLLSSILTIGCQGSNEKKEYVLNTSYPLSDMAGEQVIILSVDELKKKTILNNLPLLKVGDSSLDVVRKLGYKPNEYYPAPNKSLNSPPRYLIMRYFFKRKPSDNDPLVIEELSLDLSFSADDKLRSIMISPVLEQDISGISVPILYI